MVGLIKTGIKGLDYVLGGGIPQGHTVLISGPSGSGKTLLALDFLIKGMEMGERGMFIVMEGSKEDLLDYAEMFGWDLLEYENENQLFILDYPATEIDQFFSAYTNIRDELISPAGITRVVIDSIFPIAVYFRDKEERKYQLLKFFTNIKKWKTITMITSEATPQKAKTIYGEEAFADGWIHLYHPMVKGRKGWERKRFLEVIKMKGASHSHKLHEFVIKKGIGIEVKK